jgi:protein-S-isoprenylcysteine O-methyltransferase Ste14
MTKKMSMMGIGHKAGAIVGIYLAATAAASYIFSPVFRITENSYGTLLAIGLTLAFVGFAANLAAAVQMIKAYKSGTLAKKGLYAIFLNPMYTMQLLVTVPGITLLFNSWLVLTTIVAGLVSVRIFVKEEESYLESKFGSEYTEYREKVLIKL